MHTFRTVRARALAAVTLALVTTVSTVPPASAQDSGVDGPLAMPSVSGVAPTSGLVAGGLVITLTGRNLTGATAVTFGTVPAAGFTVVSDTTLTAVAPALGKGTVALSVTTPAGTGTAGSFTVRSYEDEVLRLVNEARGSARRCGSRKARAVPPLRADATLARVAAAHSADMAAHDYFSHDSLNGRSAFQRIRDAGYRYSSAGENIAAGFRTPNSVVKAWLKSPGHCRNIMKRSYTELGVGYAAGGYYGSYWTQDFGNPR
jgi:uncharacterized protein YkwD